ncbi:radical SAM protein [Streptosporangium canum]|uniref:radical SAM/SPASM domain-containing protein n=1 Tax=Streptosporangium canum TaxID=324952 RepID=UPI0034279B3C
MTALQHGPTPVASVNLRLLAAEVTGGCQLTCTHCYAESSPAGTDGTMTIADWKRVISEAAGLGVHQVQFIGGEPTRLTGLPELIHHTRTLDVEVEVFSNLVHVPGAVWEALCQPGVQLATSFYSDDAVEHMRITGRNTLPRTQANIVEALERSVPLRVGMVHIYDGQRVEQARALLEGLGVTRIRTDRLRVLGRPSRGVPDAGQLCGNCGHGRCAISPTGDVWPCVMSRFLPTGNVLRQPLAEVLSGPTWRDALAQVPSREGRACGPDCNPASDGNDCAPAQQVDGK